MCNRWYCIINNVMKFEVTVACYLFGLVFGKYLASKENIKLTLLWLLFTLEKFIYLILFHNECKWVPLGFIGGTNVPVEYSTFSNLPLWDFSTLQSRLRSWSHVIGQCLTSATPGRWPWLEDCHPAWGKLVDRASVEGLCSTVVVH